MVDNAVVRSDSISAIRCESALKRKLNSLRFLFQEVVLLNFSSEEFA